MVTTGCWRKMCIPKVVGKWLQKTRGSSFVKTARKNMHMLLQLKLLCDCFGHRSYQQFTLKHHFIINSRMLSSDTGQCSQ